MHTPGARLVGRGGHHASATVVTQLGELKDTIVAGHRVRDAAVVSHPKSLITA